MNILQMGGIFYVQIQQVYYLIQKTLLWAMKIRAPSHLFTVRNHGAMCRRMYFQIYGGLFIGHRSVSHGSYASY